jgi:FKBP-type peptidyl-prolyl cis-trans isomerase 2
MAIENGDVVKIDLVGRVNSQSGPVFQCTIEQVAKDEGIYDEKEKSHYEPRLVIVGKKMVLDGIEEALVGMEVGETKELVLPPEKAFGKSDPKKRQFFSLPEFRKKFKKAPRVGDSVELAQSHEQGRVVHIAQGKVIVDMNHVLADREVFYTVKVVEKMEGEDAKLKAMIEMRMPGIPASEFKIEKDGGTLNIAVPSQAVFYQQFGFSAYLLAMEIQREDESIEKVKYTLEFEKPKTPAPKEATALAEEIVAEGASDEGAEQEVVKPAKKAAKRSKKKAEADITDINIDPGPIDEAGELGDE